MANIKLTAELREETGKNRVNKLREQGSFPAAIFSKGQDTVNITVTAREFDLVFQQAGTTSIVDVVTGGKTYPAIIKEIDRHPFKNQVLHVNFQGVRMDQPIKVEVPIECLNKDSIRVRPSVFTQVLSSLHIECLPSDIPEFIAVDVIDMQIDDTISVKDLDIVKDDKITILTDLEETVCVLSHEREEVEEEEATVEAGEVPEIGKETEEE